MSMSDKQARAAAYALGVLDKEEHDAIADALETDKELADEVAHWEATLAPLALDLPMEPAPKGLFSEIEARIDRAADPLLGTTTIREAAGEWIALSDGVDMKLLREADGGRKSFLVRLAPGARDHRSGYPPRRRSILRPRHGGAR